MAGKLLGLTSDWGKERSVGEDWRLRDTPMLRPPRYSEDQLSLRLLSEQSDQMYSCLMLGTIWFWYTWLYWYRASCLMYWPTISSTSTIKTLQKLDSASQVQHVCYHFKFQNFVNGVKEYANKVACHSFYRFKIQCTKILKTNSFFVWISSVSIYHGRFLAALEVDISVQGWGDRTRWWGCCLMNSSEESTPNFGSLNGPHKFGCLGNLPHHSKLAWILLLLHKHLKTEWKI